MQVTSARADTRHAAALPRWTYLRDAVLRSYSQILFCRSHAVGLLLMLAGVVAPGLALAGLASVLLATGMARLLNLSEDQVRSGLFGYNALLVGLGGTALLPPGPAALLLTALAVVASVFVTAALHSALGSTFNLPVLTVPFLLVFPLLMAAATTLGMTVGKLGSDPVAAYLGLPGPVNLFLQSLGAVFFLPRVDVGLLVALGLLRLVMSNRWIWSAAPSSTTAVLPSGLRSTSMKKPVVIFGTGPPGVMERNLMVPLACGLRGSVMSYRITWRPVATASTGASAAAASPKMGRVMVCFTVTDEESSLGPPAATRSTMPTFGFLARLRSVATYATAESLLSTMGSGSVNFTSPERFLMSPGVASWSTAMRSRSGTVTRW